MLVKLFALCVAVFLQTCAAIVPTHIYLGYNGNPQNMRLTWTTTVNVTTTQNVHWWEASGTAHTLSVVAGQTQKFVRPNNAGTQYISSVVLGTGTHWTPYQNYTYQIRLDEADSTTWSKIYDVRGLPALNTASTIAIYGDLGAYGPLLISSNYNGLLSYARNHYFDLIIHNGDLAYNLGTNNGSIGEQFMTNLQEISARVPYVVSPGNHEYFSDNSLTYYNAYFQSQTSLGQLTGSSNPLLWYSYDYSYAHFVVINTEVYCEDTTKIADMWAWTNKTLAAIRKADPTGWIFMVGHRQMYLGTTGAFDSYLQRYGLNCTNPLVFSTCNVRKPCYTNNPAQCGFAMEPLMFKYKVDFSFEGHQHLYQRYFPVGPNYIYETQAAATYINPQYPIHVISGAGGMQSTPAKRSESSTKRASPEVAVTSASGTTIANPTSFTLTTIYNKTHIEFKQVSPDQATLIDHWWVVKDSAQPAWSHTATFTVTPTTATGCQ